MILLSSAITFGFLYYTFWKYNICWQGILFSVVFQFQFMAANQISQAISISIFLSFFHLLLERKYTTYIICVLLITFLIHYSSIFLLLAIPISLIKINRWLACICLILVYVAYLAGIWKNLGNILLTTLPIPETYVHLLSSGKLQPENVGFSIVQLFNVAMCLYAIWNKRFIDNSLSMVYFCGIILYIIFIEYHLFLRISTYFLYTDILAISLLCRKRPQKGKIVVIISALFYIMICSQESNLHGVIPYDSVIG